MKLAVALQTCERETYTARTIGSFLQHNDPAEFVCLHADDASTTAENRDLASGAGFTSIATPPVRQGMIATRLALFRAACEAGTEWVLLLENDIETLRPFPWALFAQVRKAPAIYCLRLYGRFKDAGKTIACLATHKRLGHKPVQWRAWRDASEPSQIGVIHWSAQPAVTRTRDLLSLHRTGIEPAGHTVRVKKNVMAHFGDERTPGRLA